LNEALTKGQTELTQKISETLDKSLKQSKNMNDQLQNEFSNSLKNKVEVDVAQDFQKIRDQIEKNRQELLGFMDEKLKELYPYAYQPRRKDPTEPPATPQP
jgi:hypothetical protein